MQYGNNVANFACIQLVLTIALVTGCSAPPEGRMALQATWEGIEGPDARGMLLEFSGDHFYYTALNTNYRASGTFRVYLGESPKVMVQTMTESSSDRTITKENPVLSYIIFEVYGDELKMGFSTPGITLETMPGTFDKAYYVERYRRRTSDSSTDGVS